MYGTKNPAPETGLRRVDSQLSGWSWGKFMGLDFITNQVQEEVKVYAGLNTWVDRGPIDHSQGHKWIQTTPNSPVAGR